MFYFGLLFLVVSLFAGVFGFTGLAGGAAGTVQFLSFLFASFLVISLFVGAARRV